MNGRVTDTTSGPYTVPKETNPKKAWGALKAPMNATPPTALIELNAVDSLASSSLPRTSIRC